MCHVYGFKSEGFENANEHIYCTYSFGLLGQIVSVTNKLRPVKLVGLQQQVHKTPELHQDRIVKLFTQQVLRGYCWIFIMVDATT